MKKIVAVTMTATSHAGFAQAVEREFNSRVARAVEGATAWDLGEVSSSTAQSLDGHNAVVTLTITGVVTLSS